MTGFRSQETSGPKLYVIACEVHGVKRHLAKGRGCFTSDPDEIETFTSRETARRVARSQSYSCTVEPQS